jgi:hypothetical protein
VTLWVTDIRKTALITCIAVSLSVPIPLWNAGQKIAAVESTHPQWNWWTIPMIVLGSLFAAIMPVFYFALYRNEGALRFSKRLRVLSLAAALVFGTIVAAGLPEWIGSVGAYWRTIQRLDWSGGATSILTAARDSRALGQISNLLSEFSNLACMLVLVAFFRKATGESKLDTPISRLLRLVTKVAVIAWGLWLLFNVVRLPIVAFHDFQLLDSRSVLGPRAAPFGRVLEEIRSLAGQACLFAAPYIVYKSQRQKE